METMIERTTLASTIGANVERLRMARDWSQNEVAIRLGVSRISVNRIERGRSLPESDVLFAIADLFGVSADALRQLTTAQAALEKIA